jgi:hypothetical protein
MYTLKYDCMGSVYVYTQSFMHSCAYKSVCSCMYAGM